MTFRERLTRLGYPDYRAYLAGPHWQATRARYWAAAQEAAGLYGRPVGCARCGRTDDLQLHHKTYARLGRERLSDLVLLCGEHHRATHNRLRGRRRQHAAPLVLWSFPFDGGLAVKALQPRRL